MKMPDDVRSVSGRFHHHGRLYGYPVQAVRLYFTSRPTVSQCPSEGLYAAVAQRQTRGVWNPAVGGSNPLGRIVPFDDWILVHQPLPLATLDG